MYTYTMGKILFVSVVILAALQQVCPLQLSEFYPYGASKGDTSLTEGSAIDDFAYNINLPMQLPFFHVAGITSAFITTNGFVQFNPGGSGSTEFVPKMFPYISPGFNVVACFWSDLATDIFSHIWARVTATDEELLRVLSADVKVAFNLPRFKGKMAILVTFIDAKRLFGPSSEINMQTAIVTDGVASFAFLLYHTLPDTSFGATGIAGYNVANGSHYFALPGALTSTANQILLSSNIGTFPAGKWALALVEESKYRVNLQKLCEEKVQGTYPHPENCTKFFVCSAGKLVLEDECESSSLTIHPTYGVCVWITQHNCEPDNPGNFCKNKPDGNYPDPLACTSLVTCSNFLTHRTTCPGGLYFNAAINACDWPKNVVCNIP